ncbi:MAG: hypothetical protein U1E70_23535 [Acetobacteraceae bacterium]|nr:hypothetical protein [Pseudomonadota bacterium]
MALSTSLLLGAAALHADAQTPPLEVTTDTQAYCQRLSDQVSARMRGLQSPPPEVIRLSDEGERLCDEGQIRGGILRLRRAWMMMAHPEHHYGGR